MAKFPLYDRTARLDNLPKYPLLIPTTDTKPRWREWGKTPRGIQEISIGSSDSVRSGTRPTDRWKEE